MIRWALAAVLLVGCLGDDEAETPFVCVGVDPGEAARSATPGPVQMSGGEGEGEQAPAAAPLEVGEAAPAWTLADFQPQSCGYEATYGIEAFKGRTTVVAMLAAW